MPYEFGKDKEGCWVRWGDHGKKYHYRCGDDASQARAIAKADKQRRAIFNSGWKE